MDTAETLVRKLAVEPYRTKTVERVRLPTAAERRRNLEAASYSPVHLKSKDVFVDLITDSGMSAMSDTQWAALSTGDEAYFHSRSYEALEGSVQETMGFSHVIPSHQGRAAEHILMGLLVEPGQIVLSNTHFDTTRAHVEHRGAVAVDLMSDALWDYDAEDPFKGNFDLQKLESALESHRSRTAMIVITVVNNFACSSPVSMANIREVRRIADKYDVPVWFDAARFAENAFLIRAREPGYADKSVRDIAKEMLAFGEGCWMSAKKDALVNIGGFIATNNRELAERCQERTVLFEGFHSYGGLARRDLAAMAVGLREGLEEPYLAHRIDIVHALGAALEKAGCKVSKPVGSSGVFIDVQALYPHLTQDKFPGVALCADMYLRGAIRVGAAPMPLQTVVSETGEIVDRVFMFARFAVPRRMYSRAHMEYVGAIAGEVAESAPQNRGYEALTDVKKMNHFFARFSPRKA